MNWLFSLYVAILFFILTPAVLLRIPKNGSKYTVAAVHAIVFALLLHFTGKWVWNFSMRMEGFSEGLTAAQIANNAKTRATNLCQYGNVDRGTLPLLTGHLYDGSNVCTIDNKKTWHMINPTKGNNWSESDKENCKATSTRSDCT
jgi:hypothetical protein